MNLIFWDGTGLCLFAKRLEEGVFRCPILGRGLSARVRQPRRRGPSRFRAGDPQLAIIGH